MFQIKSHYLPQREMIANSDNTFNAFKNHFLQKHWGTSLDLRLKKIKFVKSIEVDIIVLYNFSEDNKSQVSEVARGHPV